jgi:hypothetical protein
MTASKARDCWAGKEKKINSPHMVKFFCKVMLLLMWWITATRQRKDVK